MAINFEEEWSHYGVEDSAAARALMLEDGWGAVGSGCEIIATPDDSEAVACMQITPNAGGVTGFARRPLGSSLTNSFIAARVMMYGGLPDASGMRALQWLDGSNNVLFYLEISPTGVLALKDSGGSQVGDCVTASPVITANTLHHIECQLVLNAGSGTFECRVDEVVVIDESSLSTGSTAAQQISSNASYGTAAGEKLVVRDLRAYDSTGSYNNDFQGDVKTRWVDLIADDTLNWTPRYRKQYGAGVGMLVDTGDAFSTPDAAAFEIGSGDFTLDVPVRFAALPTGSNYAVLAGKWQESGDHRSWQLIKEGPSLSDGQLVFRISTDGAVGTVTEIFDWPFNPILNREYIISISRVSGVTYLFIDGIQQGPGVTDSNTYHNGDANVVVGGEMSSTTAVVANTSLTGFVDEVRLTVGTGRYAASHTPSLPYGRNVGEDASFADVELLLGFNTATPTDESGTGHTITERGDADVYIVSDGNAGYETLVSKPPLDDTVVEAAAVAATGILAPTDNPANGETVVLDSSSNERTYTFVTSLSTAYDVLIGGSLADTMDNLIAAINAAAGEGSTYGTGTLIHPTVSASLLPNDSVLITANTPGTGGNSIASTETIDGSFTQGATLSGGESIPSASDFLLDRLPLDATSVKAATIVMRHRKTDSGSCAITPSLITGEGTAADGAEHASSQTPSYSRDVIEEDPDTTAALTFATFVNANIRLDRTT